MASDADQQPAVKAGVLADATVTSDSAYTWGLKADGTPKNKPGPKSNSKPTPRSDKSDLCSDVAYYKSFAFDELAELITDRLDLIAKDYALTPMERYIQRACRAEFGFYDPTLQEQIGWITVITGVMPEVVMQYV